MTSYYLTDVADYESVFHTVQELKNQLEAHKGKFDTIVCIGTSGLLVAPIVAYELGVNLIVIRKESDEYNSHAQDNIEGVVGTRLLFIDDFISTGNTLKYVIEKLKEYIKNSDNNTNRKFVGFALYSNARSKDYQTRMLLNVAYEYDEWKKYVAEDFFVTELQSYR